MQLSSIFTLLAAGLAFVAAEEGTTTSTSTMTKTVTITQCNPTLTDCPARSTSAPSYSASSIRSFPLSNSTSTAYPTAYYNTSSTYVAPSSYPVVTQTYVVVPTASESESASASSTATTVPQSGAGGLLVQSGLLLGVLGAGVALLA
ncbi:hypothetical protein QBC33DRAFT_513221 [Phialemonium atrogriseum]|uniref:GPI anchored serine-rich protein n=1 Tax=Phialemonium atrogriseum TaxID=1093897 RepID=A0AAJ0FR28_9PEZI|nr:uncharacterized protein QBC33DRAFT_513221 [Phialemonium atrogriseum]KAK1769740.1 hypothetical protein QBC33DRAFT_513221 [Phialemonium atrogriseum]